MRTELLRNLGTPWHAAVNAAKRLIYGRRGEPYKVGRCTLRYLPGTRPVRSRYSHSANTVVRYDALQALLLRDGLSTGDTALDIGAHHGTYSLLMAAICGHEGHVVAFEPDPSARKQLERNIKLNPGIKAPVVENLALSNAEGTALLYSREGNSQSSFARTAIEFGGSRNSEAISVVVTTLDSYVSATGLSEPRWVKIDAEGAEIRILEGATNLLAGDAGVICELHPYAWPELRSSFDDLLGIAAASGRRIRYLDQATSLLRNPEYGTVVLERIR